MLTSVAAIDLPLVKQKRRARRASQCHCGGGTWERQSQLRLKFMREMPLRTSWLKGERIDPMKAGVSEGAARIGLMVRDVPAALLTMSRVRQL
ncbi:MAG: hypothetical protein E6833_36105, partial [Bradyrhizobium sp.]|nr:hypothetical protein [Bradyrhizobium sp.]